tara:strand:- start:23 stop:157 length:135 start_codon:yes stop_codon:yes gene_type:complete
MVTSRQIKEHLKFLYSTGSLHPEVVEECIEYWENKLIKITEKEQ